MSKLIIEEAQIVEVIADPATTPESFKEYTTRLRMIRSLNEDAEKVN